MASKICRGPMHFLCDAMLRGGRILSIEMLSARLARQRIVCLISTRGFARTTRIEKFELDEVFQPYHPPFRNARLPDGAPSQQRAGAHGTSATHTGDIGERQESLPNIADFYFKVESITRGHQTCHFRKRATSAHAEGPAYGLDLARHRGFPLRIPFGDHALKWERHRED